MPCGHSERALTERVERESESLSLQNRAPPVGAFLLAWSREIGIRRGAKLSAASGRCSEVKHGQSKEKASVSVGFDYALPLGRSSLCPAGARRREESLSQCLFLHPIFLITSFFHPSRPMSPLQSRMARYIH